MFAFRRWHLVVLLVLLAACATGGSKTFNGSRSTPVVGGARNAVMTEKLAPDAVPRAMKTMVDRVEAVCITKTSGDPLPTDGSMDGRLPCMQDSILGAFATEPDARFCRAYSSARDFVVCVVQGSYLNMLMDNVDIPRDLTPAEWLDPDAARQATVDHISVSTGFLCGYGGYADRERCEERVRWDVLGIGKNDAALCEHLEDRRQCEMDVSVRNFIEGKIPLIQ